MPVPELVPMTPAIVNIGGVNVLGLYMLLPLYKISIFMLSTFDAGAFNTASPRPSASPARSASFDVALFVVLAPKGPDKTAQGNALGTRNTAKNEGKSPEGAQQPTGDVSPFRALSKL
jgi:hypothetical protein